MSDRRDRVGVGQAGLTLGDVVAEWEVRPSDYVTRNFALSSVVLGTASGRRAPGVSRTRYYVGQKSYYCRWKGGDPVWAYILPTCMVYTYINLLICRFTVKTGCFLW